MACVQALTDLEARFNEKRNEAMLDVTERFAVTLPHPQLASPIPTPKTITWAAKVKQSSTLMFDLTMPCFVGGASC